MNDIFLGYAAEQSGAFEPLDHKCNLSADQVFALDEVISILNRSKDPSDEQIQLQAFEQAGIDPEFLSSAEIDYVMSQVNF